MSLGLAAFAAAFGAEDLDVHGRIATLPHSRLAGCRLLRAEKRQSRLVQLPPLSADSAETEHVAQDLMAVRILDDGDALRLQQEQLEQLHRRR